MLVGDFLTQSTKMIVKKGRTKDKNVHHVDAPPVANLMEGIVNGCIFVMVRMGQANVSIFTKMVGSSNH